MYRCHCLDPVERRLDPVEESHYIGFLAGRQTKELTLAKKKKKAPRGGTRWTDTRGDVTF